MSCVSRSAILGVVLCLLVVSPHIDGQSPVPDPAPVASRPPLTLDVLVVDGAGRAPDVLFPADLTISIDGRARPALWVRRVSRGPGAAADAAARLVRTGLTGAFAAEPSRTVVLVVDEGSVPAGAESQAVRGAAALLDRLGMNDRVAVVAVPLAGSRPVTPTLDRPPVREAINRITGRLAPDERRADGITPDASHVAGDPMGDRANRTGREAPPEGPARGVTDAASDLPADRDALDGLVRTLRAVAPMPGRKIVTLFSAGLPDGASDRVADAVRAAAEARAAVHVFGLRAPGSRYARLDSRALDRLARETGGVFVSLGGKPEQDVEHVMPALSVCFVAGVERTAADERRSLLPVRVTTPRPDLVVRASAVAAPGPFTLDEVAVPPVPTAAAAVPPPAAVQPDGYAGAGRLAPAPDPRPVRAATPGSRSADAAVLIGRLTDYVNAYLAQYSALVAEEDYRQSMPVLGQRRRLRSDLLFVRMEQTGEWVSFRDVYEVDGAPVRERDERLQDLFLHPKPGADAQLRAIKDESARYNIGSFERNINVPLFPLKFVTDANRDRFDFTLGRAVDVDGVKARRVEYVERGRPTIVVDRDGLDVPVRGAFVVDLATGAVLETEVAVARRDYTASITVRYTRDPKLGMWVPIEMKEKYRVPPSAAAMTGLSSSPGISGISVEGTARYGRFRRFQVTTDEQLKGQKR